jgi:serine/threonine protein kinase
MNVTTPYGATPRLDAGSENCLAVGTRLSDFEITGVLGEGGFGIVYLAYDHALQRTVAIKEYMPGVLAMRASNAGITLRSERHKDTFALGLKSFINEARLLAQFDHPALIKVYRFWEQNNTAYTAMKFYDGRTIKDIVTNSPELVNEAWCRAVLRQILEALEMLYTMQILHRDISPDNIIVQENGDAVLLDFGSARQIIGDMTSGLTVILKPGYAPVEQYAGDGSLGQGPFTDLYSLSAVMYFAITKAPPPASIGRMISDSVVALTARAPAGYGEPMLAAIDKGLAVLAQDRPQTIAEFRSLLGIAPLEPLPARPPLAPPRTLPPVRHVESPALASTAPVAAHDLPSMQQRSNRTAAAASVAGHAVTPSPRRRRCFIGAGAASVLAIAAAGLYALGLSSNQDTVKLAQPQPEPHRQALPPVTAAFADTSTAPSGANGAPSVATPTTPPATPKPEVEHASAPVAANYKLQIKPWGALFVDGRSLGVSPPLKQVRLTPGKHKIRIVNPSFPEYSATIEVGKNKSGAIEHVFSSTP